METDGELNPAEWLDPFALLAPFPEVVANIFASLPVSDLLKCSEVSSLWRENISAILATKKCFAYVSKNCTDICRFNHLLESAKYCTINAMSIHVERGHSRCLTYLTKNDRLKSSASIKKLPLRTFHAYVSSCEASQQLMQEILLGAASTLEELTLSYSHDSSGYIVLDDAKLAFPRLTVINITKPFNYVESEVFQLITLAPNLKAVNGLCWLSELRTSPCKRLDLFTGMSVHPFEELDEMFKLLVNAKPKLQELQILDLESRPIPKLWSAPLRQLLQQSTNTLKSLSICAIKLLKLRKTFVLQALDYLKLFLPEDLTLEEVQNAVAGLDLKNFSPNLKSLRLSFGRGCSHKIPSTLSTYAYDASTPINSVREVTTEMAVCTTAIVESCITAFPLLSVFAFEVLRCAEMCESISEEHFYEVHRIWTEIATLEKLKLCLVGSEIAPRRFSLDALFCGLSTDEARHLRRVSNRDEQNICRFQLCPARPSILYAQSLRQVTVVFSPNYTYKYFSISELSGIQAFHGHASLRLKLESHCPAISNELQCLAGFAEIVTITDKRDWW